ncbi:methyl-accepting chemotaxis protein [Sporomusaceae bacterium BoRhaA]|uniref:methyl-accepting chemotaxis protein n=1 Tax=Pelorhabdus rhamnosifermentans TaxID=2772457 RepID=UPI001C062292|nr:methyl-accepting chemotaxis protein [Pelorhabdus rhamnosifermentans]MBU2700115.1 methyl-accepting chemotaxis protein [Pelorhabdus rhamnosifermentans]
MNFFDNLKVSLKLSILILVAFLSMSIIGYTGYHYLQLSNTEMTIMYEDHLVPVALINENRAHVNKVNAAIMELMLTTDDKKNQELRQTIDEWAKNFNDNLAALDKEHLDDKTKEKLAGIKTAMQKYREARNIVIELAMQNKNAEAYAIYTAKVDPLAADALNRLIELSNYSIEASKQMNANNKASFEKANQITLAIIFVSFIILILSGVYITRIITKPLNTMVFVCKEFAAGDFRDKPRKLARKDEIGQLADALADMRSSLRVLMKNVNESAEHLAASSEELTASADQSAQAANQVAGSITDVAKGAEQQLDAANNTSAIVQQMSASIQQVAANANEVAGQSVQAANKANEGNKSIDKAVNQMTNIKETVNTSAKMVTKLGERSKEIGQIVDTISGIAGQTNLLALNAAIEAARAGEQGRGFAVVAEEVRKLAEQSQEAAKQIATLISEIQGDTDKAVIAMNNGTQEVQLGSEVVNVSGQAFQEISTVIMHVSDQVKEISDAIEQMAIGSQQIVGSVKQIDELSKKAAGEAQTVSAATEEQSASMEEIASSSQALAHLAMDLREVVSKFQI